MVSSRKRHRQASLSTRVRREEERLLKVEGSSGMLKRVVLFSAFCLVINVVPGLSQTAADNGAPGGPSGLAPIPTDGTFFPFSFGGVGIVSSLI